MNSETKNKSKTKYPTKKKLDAYERERRYLLRFFLEHADDFRDHSEPEVRNPKLIEELSHYRSLLVWASCQEDLLEMIERKNKKK